jgi:hypothetical protein
VDVLRAPVASLRKANLEGHGASMSAATKGNPLTSKALLVGKRFQGKRRAEEQEKEGLVPKKPKITHLLSSVPATQSQQRQSVAAQNTSAASVAAATVESRKRKCDFEKGPSSENVKSSAPEKIPANSNFKSTANAVVAKAKDLNDPAPVAGNKRKLEARQDVKTSAETEAKRQRVSGLRQTAKLDNSKPWPSQKSSEVREPPRALHNSANACYINATMQLLHTIPELAKVKVPGNANARYYSPHTDDEEWKIAEKRAVGKSVKKELKLVRGLLEKPAVKQQL